MPNYEVSTPLSRLLTILAGLYGHQVTMSPDLLSADAFETALLRERARSDRSGHQFSMVLFAISQQPAKENQLRLLSQELVGRIRETDQAGYFDRSHVGAILPYTSFEGACALADDMCQRMAKAKTSLTYSIYTYPRRGSTGKGDQIPMLVSRAPLSRMRSEGSVSSAPPSRLHTGSFSSSPRFSVTIGGGHQGGNRGENDLSFVQPMPLWKRLLDVTGAVTGLILLSPVMLVAFVGIKLSSPGPAIFRQKRAGLASKPFVMYKFRTMVAKAEMLKKDLLDCNKQNGPAFKLKNDPRVTGFGRLLRRMSIDEVPQLWNVLKGDMSLVGPRPLPVDESDACATWQRRRLEVTPGLTCIWQVSGRSDVDFGEWVRMDVRYALERSLIHDLKILLRTIPAVLTGKGAY